MTLKRHNSQFGMIETALSIGYVVKLVGLIIKQ